MVLLKGHYYLSGLVMLLHEDEVAPWNLIFYSFTLTQVFNANFPSTNFPQQFMCARNGHDCPLEEKKEQTSDTHQFLV